MNIKSALFGAVAGALIGVLGTLWLTPKPVPGDPVIREIVVTKTVYKTPPQTPCEASELWLKADAKAGVMHIDYGDACKAATAEVKIDCKCPESETDWKGYGIAGAIGFAAGVTLVIILGGGAGK